MTDPATARPVTEWASAAVTVLPGSQRLSDVELPVHHYGIVVDDSGSPLAIVTTTDIERARHAGASALSALASVVLKAVTIPADWTLADARTSAAVMREAETHPYGLVVLAGTEIVGVLPSELLRAGTPEASPANSAYPPSPPGMSPYERPPSVGEPGAPQSAPYGTGSRPATPLPPSADYGGIPPGASPESTDAVFAGDADTSAVRVVCDHPACGYENDIEFYDPDRRPTCANPGLHRHTLAIREK